MEWIIAKSLTLVSSKLAMKFALSVVKVIVKRTDNKWDDELLDHMMEKEL